MRLIDCEWIIPRKKISLPQEKEKNKCLDTYVILNLIETMV